MERDALARLPDGLVRAWPVPVEEITLIGHSMGGLVVRSACHYGPTHRGRPVRSWFHRSWTARVRRVVLLGAPNTGAPLEMLATIASAALWALPLPPARLVGLGLGQRSAGIRDLRFGALLEGDWLEQDPDARRRPTPHRVRPLRRADYLLVAGHLAAQPDTVLARILGDALVTVPSATGRLAPTAEGDRSLFPGSTSRVLPSTSHLALAADPGVYGEIDRWWRG